MRSQRRISTAWASVGRASISKSEPTLLLMLALPALAQAVEILRWERIPLAIPLTVGQERIVFVDRNVRVGVPRGLQGKLRVQSTGGAGAVASGTASGDWTLSCVRGQIRSLTFVFNDGTVRTFPAPAEEVNDNQSNNNQTASADQKTIQGGG